MKNFIAPGRNISIPAAADTASGDVVVAGALVGIAAGAALSGATLDVALEGIYAVSKVSAETFAVGALVYFNTSTKLATSTVGSNPVLGHAIEAAGNGAAAVKVRLKN